VSFVYIGNTIRYDVETNNGILFKVDIQTHGLPTLSMGEKVYVSFVKTTLGIPTG
jgi:hypothetical protein